MNPYVGLALIVILTFLMVVWMRRRRPRRHSLRPRGDQKLRTPIANLEVLCLQGPAKGQRFAFNKKELTIGRKRDSDILVPGALVSRTHARLGYTEGGIILRDLESTNGTWTMGRRIDETLLPEQQPFQVGPAVFTVVRAGKAGHSRRSQASANALPSVSHSDLRSMALEHYERLRVIGEGGAATVYLCRARNIGRLVAIKVLHYSADPYFKRKFHQEGEFGLELQHPHIVQTLGKGEANGLSYIVMEHMSAGSLRERMTGSPISLEEAVDIVGQICSALHYAHQRQIYHRDIKPENILFSSSGVAKLGDFGIARFAGMRTVTREGMLIGTPEYMSYEQARGTKIDGRSDQYALAIVLYEMLSGVRPFDGEPLSVVGQHLNKKPISPRQINPNIPSEVDRVIMKALDKNKAKRYPDVMTMAKELDFREGRVPSSAPLPNSASSRSDRGLGGIAQEAGASDGRFRLVNLRTHQTLSLTGPATVVGRDNLDSPYVSQQHARFLIKGSHVFVVDLRSRNGTFVNEQRVVGEIQLIPGCIVRFGPERFRFLAQ